MDHPCIILLVFLPFLVNGQLGEGSSFMPIVVRSSTKEKFNPPSISSPPNFIPETGIITQTGDKSIAKVGSILQVGNIIINDLEAIRDYQLTTPVPLPSPLKVIIGTDGIEYVIIDGRLYSLPSIQGAIPITQPPLLSNSSPPLYPSHLPSPPNTSPPPYPSHLPSPPYPSHLPSPNPSPPLYPSHLPSPPNTSPPPYPSHLPSPPYPSHLPSPPNTSPPLYPSNLPSHPPPSNPPPMYNPYGPSITNLPKSPTRNSSPYYSYCPRLTRYGDNNVWCFLYDRKMQRTEYAYLGVLERREVEERKEDEERREGREGKSIVLKNDSIFHYDPSLFMHIVI